MSNGTEVTGSTIGIGTLPECQIQLDGTGISPRHAEIYGSKLGNETAAYLNCVEGQVSLNGAPPQMLQDIRLSDGDVIKVGEYAIIHAGFAIGKLDEQEALENLQLIREVLESEEDKEAGET